MKSEIIKKWVVYAKITFLVGSIVTGFLYIVTSIIVFMYISMVGNAIVIILVFVDNRLHQKIKSIVSHTVYSKIAESQKKSSKELSKLLDATALKIKNNSLLSSSLTEETAKIEESLSLLTYNNSGFELYPDNYETVYSKLIANLIYIVQSLHTKLSSLNNLLGNLCPIHLPLDLALEWDEFINKRFDASFEYVKDAIRSLQKLQEQSIEYVQYVLTILKGFKDKRAVQFDEMMSFYARMRSTQESFAQYLSTVSQTFQAIKEIMIQVEEITDKINILSLNMSIEANKLTGNNVFSVIAKELHLFSEQTIKYFEPMKKAIEQNLTIIEEKRKEESDAILQIQEFINLSEKMIKDYEDNIEQFTKLIDNISNVLLKQDGEAKDYMFRQFEDLQKLVIIKEEISHKDKFFSMMLQKANDVIQQCIRQHKICDGIDCMYRIESFKALEQLITTADERVFLKQLYRKYLNRELEDSEHKEGDVILF